MDAHDFGEPADAPSYGASGCRLLKGSNPALYPDKPPPPLPPPVSPHQPQKVRNPSRTATGGGVSMSPLDANRPGSDRLRFHAAARAGSVDTVWHVCSPRRLRWTNTSRELPDRRAAGPLRAGWESSGATRVVMSCSPWLAALASIVTRSMSENLQRGRRPRLATRCDRSRAVGICCVGVDRSGEAGRLPRLPRLPSYHARRCRGRRLRR